MLCLWIIYGQLKEALKQQKTRNTLLLVPHSTQLMNRNVNFPFNMRTLLPEKKSRPEVVPQIWEYSRKHYARPLAEVEAEIQEAWIGKKEDEPEKGIGEKLSEEADAEGEEEGR